MSRVLFLALPLLLLAELLHVAEGSTSSERENVVTYVLAKGNKHVRPDGRQGDGLSPVKVGVAYYLHRIVDLDEERGLLKTSGFLFLNWNDSRVAFDHLTFRGQGHNVSSVRLHTSDIWVPDIELYNTDSPSLRSMADHYRIVAYPNGEMYWVPQVTYTSFCQHSRNGRFNCTLRFGSWTYSDEDVDVEVPETPSMNELFPNPRWVIGESSVRRLVTHYDCCPNPYIIAEYTFLLFRQ